MEHNMEILINPKESKLGVITAKYEVKTNDAGILAVSFRYKPEDMKELVDGVQMQFETIKVGASRGGHYHYPENAFESFYVLKGSCSLIICDINKVICEIYSIEKGITYSVPGMIAHKAVNTSAEQVEMLVAKPFNFEIVNRTTLFDMKWTDELVELDEMYEMSAWT